MLEVENRPSTVKMGTTAEELRVLWKECIWTWGLSRVFVKDWIGSPVHMELPGRVDVGSSQWASHGGTRPATSHITRLCIRMKFLPPTSMENRCPLGGSIRLWLHRCKITKEKAEISAKSTPEPKEAFWSGYLRLHWRKPKASFQEVKVG